MRRKQNFAFSPPLFFRFSCLIFFSLAGHLIGFILVARVFTKAFRILGLGERKGRWVMEQDFHGDFQVNVRWFFACFSGVLDWIVLILVWLERFLHSAQVSEESCPWPLKLITSQRIESTWIRTGGYGRFRGEWVKVMVLMKPCQGKIPTSNMGLKRWHKTDEMATINMKMGWKSDSNKNNAIA